MTPVRSLAASVVALGFASTLTAPTPALAAPAPCDRAENYAAQSGSEIFRIRTLDSRPPADRNDDADRDKSRSSADPTGRPSAKKADQRTDEGGETAAERATALLESVPDEPAFRPVALRAKAPAAAGRVIRDVGVGDSRAVLIADAPIASAAAARMLNGKATGAAAVTTPLVQQAPPSQPGPAQRRTPSQQVGPLRIGSGALSALARWQPGMGCGTVSGEASRSAATLNRATIAGGGHERLIHVPERLASTSSTALQRRGDLPRAEASAGISAGRIDLFRGTVRIRVLRPPALRAGMATGGDAEVHYQPAVLEVSGPGQERARLEAAGDNFEIALSDVGPVTESHSGLIERGAPVPLPALPALPLLGEPETTPAPNRKPGTVVRISLGAMRQATKGNAVAARATAIKVAVSRSVEPGRRAGQGYGKATVVAEVGFGFLEAAAVAPERVARGGVSDAVAGVGGASLPITGPRSGLLATAGGALVLGGVVALLVGWRRRRQRFAA